MHHDYPRPEVGGGERGSHLLESCGSFCSHRGCWEAFMRDKAVGPRIRDTFQFMHQELLRWREFSNTNEKSFIKSRSDK